MILKLFTYLINFYFIVVPKMFKFIKSSKIFKSYALSELALSTASHDTVLRLVEWWIHIFSWYLMLIICVQRRDDVVATLSEVNLNSPPLKRVAKRKKIIKWSKKFNYKNHLIFMSHKNKQMMMCITWNLHITHLK